MSCGKCSIRLEGFIAPKMPTGDPDFADTQALLNVVRDGYRPFQVLALGGPSAHPSDVPLLRNRGLVEGQGEHARPAAYMCRAFACQAPVADPDRLRARPGRQEAGSRAPDKL
jgi:uncharacterized protein YyaL (SSP411 family)